MTMKKSLSALSIALAATGLAGCITISDSFNKTAATTPAPVPSSASDETPAIELDVQTSRNEIVINGKSIPCPEMEEALKKFNAEAVPPFKWTPRDGVYSPLDVVANFCLKRQHGPQNEVPPPKAPVAFSSPF